MSKRFLVFAALALICLVAGTAVAGAASSAKLSATLSGKKELGKGAPAGKGTFTAAFKSGKLCYALKFSGLSKPVAAHIHKGTAKQNGNIVVDLQPTFHNGAAARCVSIKASLATAIRKHASAYYVNVHTQKLPNGAIRGQLSFG
ncbi:MAG: CHRD domain-containing protein [Actinomycetota bacterium]|nr:CHRD domain-containing protein [Actinomycetota bacterium]